MTRTLALTLALVLSLARATRADDKPAPTADELIQKALPQLLACEEEGGQWPYEGVYRVDDEIPAGYRIGGTSIAALALAHAVPAGQDPKVDAAIERAVGFVLNELEHPLMKPVQKIGYDVRIWGHGYALELLCRLRGLKRLGKHEEAALRWIPLLVNAIEFQEVPGGGWNYATRKQAAAFVTAPLAQALLLARSQGEKVSDDVLARARKFLEGCKDESGYVAYSGTIGDDDESGEKKIPGAIARMPATEATLIMLGGGDVGALRKSIDAFHRHWDELEKRRKKTGTHMGPYAIAPYYFYYGHRYAAQAIELLPPEERPKARARLLETILKTRDEDGTWNDRVFARSRNYGTSMCVLALLGEKQPAPPRLEKK
jgi:hypothetical protein